MFAYLVPYWRRLVLVLAISLISTATTLVIPYLSKDLIDHALIGRDLDALRRIVYWFVALGVLGFILNVTSGLRYTRVSAEILFDMRLSLYAHLQRLSPRFYARTRLGDIVVAAQQRHQRDPAGRRGSRARLGRQRAVPGRQPGR